MSSLDSKPSIETTSTEAPCAPKINPADTTTPPQTTSADAPSSPKTNPTDTTTPPQTTSAALQALFYDHGSKPNTGNVIPISEWEKILIGKEWIREDAEGNENVRYWLSIWSLLVLSETIDVQAIGPAEAE